MKISSHSRQVAGNSSSWWTRSFLIWLIAYSDTLVKSSSITIPVAMEGLMKDIFTYPPSSQASSKMLTKPTDSMQINND